MRVKVFKFFTEATNSLKLIKFLSISKEWRWKTEERAVVNFINILELEALLDKGCKLLGSLAISDVALNNLKKVFVVCISLSVWIKL